MVNLELSGGRCEFFMERFMVRVVGEFLGSYYSICRAYLEVLDWRSVGSKDTKAVERSILGQCKS